jgi:hypothetical protein
MQVRVTEPAVESLADDRRRHPPNRRESLGDVPEYFVPLKGSPGHRWSLNVDHGQRDPRVSVGRSRSRGAAHDEEVAGGAGRDP